jgi:hypothetical protein
MKVVIMAITNATSMVVGSSARYLVPADGGSIGNPSVLVRSPSDGILDSVVVAI